MFSPLLNLDKIREASEAVSAYDTDLNVTLWNPSCERRFHIAEKDAIGRNIYDLFPHAKYDHRSKFLSIAMSVNQTFFFSNMIYLYIQPYTYYTQYIHPLKENGRVIGVINIVRDHEMEEFYKVDEFLHFFDKDTVEY